MTATFILYSLVTAYGDETCIYDVLSDDYCLNVWKEKEEVVFQSNFHQMWQLESLWFSLLQSA